MFLEAGRLPESQVANGAEEGKLCAGGFAKTFGRNESLKCEKIFIDERERKRERGEGVRVRVREKVLEGKREKV